MPRAPGCGQCHVLGNDEYDRLIPGVSRYDARQSKFDRGLARREATMSPSLHANVSHLHQAARYPLRAWLTALVAVTVLGLLTGIQLLAAPIKAKQTVKVVTGKHPPKDRRVAAE